MGLEAEGGGTGGESHSSTDLSASEFGLKCKFHPPLFFFNAFCLKAAELPGAWGAGAGGEGAGLAGGAHSSQRVQIS